MTHQFKHKIMKKTILSVALLAFVFSACNKEDIIIEKPTLPVATSYESANYAANTAQQLDLRTRMATLVSKAKSVRTAGVSVTRQELLDLYTSGSPALQAAITSYYNNVLASFDGYFQIIEDASAGGSYVPGEPAGQGGYFEGRVFDEFGIEPDEVIDKGMYGAVLFNAATAFMNSNISLEDVDRLVALYGANPTFPNSGSSNVSQPDLFMANYAARRDKNDGNGLYSQFKNAALRLRTYIAGGTAYQDERNTALNDLRLSWEKASAATVINYLHGAIGKFSLTNPSNADIASGLHSYSEGVGFIRGFKTIPQTFKKITDAQIDEILNLMNAPSGANPSTYTFVTDAFNQVPKLQTAITRLQSIYSFSNQEIEDFKKNWVTEQGR